MFYLTPFSLSILEYVHFIYKYSRLFQLFKLNSLIDSQNQHQKKSHI